MSFPPSQIAAKVVEYTHWGASSRENSQKGCGSMREFTVGPNDAGQRLDRWLAKTLPFSRPPGPEIHPHQAGQTQRQGGPSGTPAWPRGSAPALHQRRVFRHPPTPENAFLSVFKPQLDILYEDENLPWSTNGRGWWSTPDEGGAGQHPHHPHPGLPLSEKGVEPLTRSTPLPLPCATGLTATPAASSSPPKTPRPCGSSTRRSGTGRWRSPTSA